MADMERDDQFQKQGLGVREVLQTVEDALMDTGYEDFAVAIEHGTFQWHTVDRARQEDMPLLKALRDAQAVLAEHVEPDGPDARCTIDRLLAILDDEQLVEVQRAIDPKARALGGDDDMRDDPPALSR